MLRRQCCSIATPDGLVEVLLSGTLHAPDVGDLVWPQRRLYLRACSSGCAQKQVSWKQVTLSSVLCTSHLPLNASGKNRSAGPPAGALFAWPCQTAVQHVSSSTHRRQTARPGQRLAAALRLNSSLACRAGCKLAGRLQRPAARRWPVHVTPASPCAAAVLLLLRD